MYKIIGADGNQYGPVSLDELKSWVRDRRANGETLAQGVGMTDWKPLKFYPEFSDVLSPAPAQPHAAVAAPLQPQSSINDYLVPAIIATLCCCLPAGVAGIVYAAQAKSKLAIGDYAGAADAANKAKMWTWISVGVGALIGIGYSIIMVLGGMTS